MGRLRVLEVLVALGLVLAAAAWVTGGIPWTNYTPTSTTVVKIPAWPFAVGLLAILVVLVAMDVLVRRKPE